VFLLYDVLATAAVGLLLLPWELLRRAVGTAGPEVLRERLGRVEVPEREAPRVHIHAVSVGEMNAAAALVSELTAVVPDVCVSLTTGNRDGLASGRALAGRHPQIDSVSLLPWDRAEPVRAWLARLRPACVLVVETEIWPNLFRQSANLGIPLAIVSGRVPARDVRRYRLARPFFRRVLACARWIGAQTPRDGERFVGIGAEPGRIEVMGNLKADAADGAEASASWNLGGRAGELVVAGSTHAPEELWLVDTFAALRRRRPDLRLVIAPRHVKRAASVARLARRKGLRAALASASSEDWEVLVVDRLGDLSAAYAVADVVVIGGTFADRGGHNPLEAAARGKPILAGPHRESFEEVFARLEAAGALASARNAAELPAELEALLNDPARRLLLGRRTAACWLEGLGVARAYALRVAEELGVTQGVESRPLPSARGARSL
jgi:3-deoxy-D-manno-octulosonic-acid transferase